MADDRLYLQCNICGGKFYLGKQFAWGAFHLDKWEVPFEERLNTFYEAHEHDDADVCRWNGNYSIIYETDEWSDFDEIVVPYKHEIVKKCEYCAGLSVCEKNWRKRE